MHDSAHHSTCSQNVIAIIIFISPSMTVYKIHGNHCNYGIQSITFRLCPHVTILERGSNHTFDNNIKLYYVVLKC